VRSSSAEVFPRATWRTLLLPITNLQSSRDRSAGTGQQGQVSRDRSAAAATKTETVGADSGSNGRQAGQEGDVVAGNCMPRCQAADWLSMVQSRCCAVLETGATICLGPGDCWLCCWAKSCQLLGHLQLSLSSSRSSLNNSLRMLWCRNKQTDSYLAANMTGQY
jgi:hypothetical protein